MRFYMMLALLVLLAGCKKNKFSTLEMGAEHKMIVTNQDKVLTPEKGDGYGSNICRS